MVNLAYGRGASRSEWVMAAEPTSELRDKPWSLPQVLNGPIAILAGIISVHEATPDPANPTQPRAPLSHVRVKRNRPAVHLRRGAFEFAGNHRRLEPGGQVISLLAYSRPFLQPLPVWNIWYLLLLPLCAAVSIVYKSVKCADMSEVPREALNIFLWILAAFVGAGAALAVVVHFA